MAFETPTTTCSRFYVWHPEGSDAGLIAPEFSSREEAEAKRDEWNKEIDGHKVLESLGSGYGAIGFCLDMPLK